MAEGRLFVDGSGAVARVDGSGAVAASHGEYRAQTSAWAPVVQTLNEIADEHRVLLWLALSYVLLGGLIQFALERPWPLQVMNRWFTCAWVGFSVPWLAWQWVRHPRRLAAALAPRRLGGALFVFALALPVQITFQSLKQSIGPAIGFSWDVRLSNLDKLLHGGPAWRWFEPIVRHPSSLSAFDALYTLWFIALIGFVLWASWSKRRVLRQQALLAFMLLWILGATIAAALFASVGPCYYHHVTAADPAYTELVETIRSQGPLWAGMSQDILWAFLQADGWKHFGGISAFPSMHVGFTVLLAIIGWRANRVVGTVLWIFAGLTQIGSVVLAWHYAIDGYGGALIAWWCWSLAGRLAGEGLHDDTTAAAVAR